MKSAKNLKFKIRYVAYQKNVFEPIERDEWNGTNKGRNVGETNVHGFMHVLVHTNEHHQKKHKSELQKNQK